MHVWAKIWRIDLKSRLAIKILVDECQEVNAHIHLPTVRMCKKFPTGEMASFCVDAMVCGHHEYRDIWTATSGERLICACKIGNHSDLFVVAVTVYYHCDVIQSTLYKPMCQSKNLFLFS